MAIDAEAAAVWARHFGNAEWGRDVCGALMRRGDHGQRGDYGWHKDHIIPLAKDGPDNLNNMRPLHWENNRAKDDNLDGDWYCAKTS